MPASPITLTIPGKDAIKAQISPVHAKELDGALAAIQGDMIAEQEAGYETLEKHWRAWTQCHTREEIIADTVALAEKARKRFDALLVLGIGGSDLAPRLISEVLDGPAHNQLSRKDRGGGMEVHFGGDTFDVRRLNAILRDLANRKKLKRTLVNIVSRSGKTAETFGASMLVRDAMIDAGVEDPAKRVVATTQKTESSLLFRKNGGADGDALFGMLPVPDGVGGRFSAASPVGLFPMALAANADVVSPKGRIDAAMAGYAAAHEQAFGLKSSARGNVAFRLAKWLHLAEAYAGKQTLLLYNYADDRYLGDWFTQLYSESIQERGGGLDVIGVRGPTGNHSILNGVVRGPRNKVVVLVRWDELDSSNTIVPEDPDVSGDLADLKDLPFGKIQDASLAGTIADLTANSVPNVLITVPRRDEASLFGLMRILMDAVAVKGRLQGLHVTADGSLDLENEPTYQQDGVEGYKNQTRAKLAEIRKELGLD